MHHITINFNPRETSTNEQILINGFQLVSQTKAFIHLNQYYVNMNLNMNT